MISRHIIISLTSYPKRINTVHLAVKTLLNQSLKADMVILWLSETEFPNKEKDLPLQLLDLKKNGLIIDWCKDIKSFKKIIPTLKKFPNSIIVTADDDIIYPTNWLEELYNAYLKQPDIIHCHRGHKIMFSFKKEILSYKNWLREYQKKEISYNIFPTSGAGVLYPPNCFYKDILQEELFMKIASSADDIWLWAMLVMNNKKIKIIKNNMKKLNLIENSQETALFDINFNQGKNDIILKDIIKFYPELLIKLDKCFFAPKRFLKWLLKQIFSIKNTQNRTHKIITLLGLNIKIEIKNKKLKKNELFNKFIYHNIRPNSVLLVELNEYHGECLPGMAKYFIELGYNVDVLMNKKEFDLNPFAAYNNKHISLYSAYPGTISDILCSNIIKKYEHLYINSDRIYQKNISEYIGNDLKYPIGKTIVMCHHAELYNKINLKAKNMEIVTLVDFPILNNKKYKQVNTHFFKETINTNKNEITKFIVVGNIEASRKNHNLLINTVENLINKNITNFKIVVISRSGKIELPEKIEKFFEFKNNLPYNQMYNEIECADFFLTLFDPENIEHNRYLTSGASGSYQLMYGFKIPGLIPHKFQARINGFDNTNSIGYESNNDLTNAMEIAIKMSNKEYHKYTSNLNKLANEIYDKSLKNLKELLYSDYKNSTNT